MTEGKVFFKNLPAENKNVIVLVMTWEDNNKSYYQLAQGTYKDLTGENKLSISCPQAMVEVCSTLKMWNIPELFTIAEKNFLLLVLLFVLPLPIREHLLTKRLLDFSFQEKQVGNSAC